MRADCTCAAVPGSDEQCCKRMPGRQQQERGRHLHGVGFDHGSLGSGSTFGSVHAEEDMGVCGQALSSNSNRP